MPDLLCTAFDVIDQIPQLYTSEDDSYDTRTLEDIENTILETDGEIRAALRLMYGTDLTSGITPWSKVPRAKKGGRYHDDHDNTGTGVLSPFITIASSAITELWTITFTSSTAYTFMGSISGSQGTGSTSSNSTSTNGYITIPSAKWSGTSISGDIFYIRVYEIEPLLVHLSAMKAAESILEGVFTEWIPNRSEGATVRRSKADALLKKLTDSDSNVSLEVGRSSRDISPIQIPWGVDEEGSIIGDFAPDQFSGFDSENVYNET